MTLADFRMGPKHCLICLTWVVCMTVFFHGNAFGQDESLEVLKQQWSEMEAKFIAKEAEINSGEGDAKALREEFIGMIDQANELIGKLKSASLKAFESDPSDESATTTLLGIMLNDAQNGNDEEVLAIGDKLIANNLDSKYFETAAGAERLSIDAKEIFEELLVRQRETAANDLPRVKLTTNEGEIVVELYENQAPNTVANFVSLVESGYYSDMLFHRVLEDFMAQTGGFSADGSKKGEGPGYTIECECYSPETRPHFSHCLSMAHGGRNTGGGQFFLTFKRTDFLDGRHTCFGRIISGADVLDKIERTHISINGDEQPIPNIEKDKIISAEIIRKRDHEYKPKKVGEDEAAAESENTTPDLTPPDSANPDAKKESDGGNDKKESDGQDDDQS